jgi:hypothetical protein
MSCGTSRTAGCTYCGTAGAQDEDDPEEGERLAPYLLDLVVDGC